MRGSMVGSILIISLALFLIIRLNRKNAPNKYEVKSKNMWNSLSEGIDPTNE
jgi:preprotein translocase subunit YajC